MYFSLSLKKLTAILLVCLFAFNLFGYRILFYSMQHRSDIRMEKSLDENQYKDADLVTITIPVSMPYHNNWSDFERFDGEVSYKGKIYRYVKRKVCEGNLILKCLPDHGKMKLEDAKNSLFEQTADLSSPASEKSNGQKSNIEKSCSLDYTCYRPDYSLPAFFDGNTQDYFNTNSSLTSIFALCHDRPPKWS